MGDEILRFAQEEDSRKEIKGALQRALTQLSKAKASKEELVEAVYRAACDVAVGLDIPPVPPPRVDARGATEETAVAVLSDFQLGKRTPSYNSEVCERRVEEYARCLVNVTTIQRAEHPVRDLRVYLLGDIVEGELIFPGQSHLIDSSLYQQVLETGPRILINFLRTALKHFQHVHVVGVIGNHGSLGGRARKEYHPESNADAMLYRVVQRDLTNEPRLTWAPISIPSERRWYATDQVGEKTFFLFHGDQIKGGFAGYPWYGFGKKLLGWRTAGQIPNFDYALSGHFHTPVRMYLNGLTLWGNGSTESDNTYALEQLAAAGEPCQWLLFVHPRRGVTAEYLLRLDE